ncbi:MAG: PucR family transcriptional regulator [Firmicutes bacterium]|nr:PucR family transcriptional regulator [Bacillota bacterium]
MTLKVKDLFDIEIFRNFRLVAGEGGLNRPVKTTEILDFEFIQGADMDRKNVFEGESITLTSLLYAIDNPQLITDAVRRLNELNVSCMAYKTAVVSQLPQEAIDYANSHNFPILEFGGDEFFEDIIFAVRKEIGAGQDLLEIEMTLEDILDKSLSAREISRFAKRLNPEFKRYVRCVGIMGEIFSSEKISALLKSFSRHEKIGRKASLCKFREGLFIILTQDTDEISRFNALLTDVLTVLELEPSAIHMGFSTVRRMDGQFDKVVREAFWSCIVAAMEEKSSRQYEELGIYRFITSEINSPNLKEYADEFLKPLTDGDGELLRTAKTYIMCRGDMDAAAKRLFCHKNTVRYRLSRIQEMVAPETNEKEFFENLALAVRIYMLMKYRDR